MGFSLRCIVRILGSFILLAVTSGVGVAQTYPAGPVRMIVPFPPGGGVDDMARILGKELSVALGKSIVIDNRAGANGNIGTEIAAKAPHDGYTLLFTGAGLVTNVSLYRNLPFDPVRDFAPISLVAFAPNVLVVHPSVPAKSVAAFIALAKAKPGELTYGSAGSGSTPHLAAELFKSMAHIDIVHIPYKGTGPATIALLSGEISSIFLPAIAALPQVKSGRLRALAATSRERLPSMPQLPTIAESGLSGYESSQWYGVLAPAGTPQEILNLHNSHIVRIMQAADIRKRLINDGSVPVGSTREQFASHIKTEIAKWANVVRQSGARLD
jgi:tripartite-type tricarboxylate transporter receptor subunit TctC